MIEINSPQKAYVLGLLWADGYTHNTGNQIFIALVEDDLALLEPLFSSFNYKVTKRQRPNRRPQMTITISDGDLTCWLRSLGFKDKYVASAKLLLNEIPEHLKQFWFRGYFDGDGCFYHSKNHHTKQAVLSGHHDQDFAFFTELLDELECTYSQEQISKINPKSGVRNSHARIRLCGHENIKKFGNFIYNSSVDIGLARKYNKCLEILSHAPTPLLSYEVKGVTRLLREWLVDVNITHSSFNDRIRNGWELEKALTTPKGQTKLYNG